MSKITTNDFRAAKREAKKVIADVSAAHRVALETLTRLCPRAGAPLLQDMAWQCVMAARY